MLCWGKSDVPGGELTLEKVWDASELQVLGANTSDVLHLISLKLHAAFRKAMTENNGQAGWEFSIWEILVFFQLLKFR